MNLKIDESSVKGICFLVVLFSQKKNVRVINSKVQVNTVVLDSKAF